MEIKKSELSLKEFTILNASFSSSMETEEVINFDNYKVEIDFRISEDRKNESFENVMMLNINSPGENSLPGYSFSIVALGNFKIENYEIQTPEKIANLLYRSSVPMMIANLRAYAFNLTSYGKYGKYTLPSVDILDLLKKQKTILEQKSESKLTNKTKNLARAKNKSINDTHKLSQ